MECHQATEQGVCYARCIQSFSTQYMHKPRWGSAATPPRGGVLSAAALCITSSATEAQSGVFTYFNQFEP